MVLFDLLQSHETMKFSFEWIIWFQLDCYLSESVVSESNLAPRFNQDSFDTIIDVVYTDVFIAVKGSVNVNNSPP